MTMTFGLLVLLGAGAAMLIIDYFTDSRTPSHADVTVSDGGQPKVFQNAVINDVTRYSFSMRGFIIENGAKVLLLIIVAFVAAPLLTDDTKIRMQQLVQKLDNLGHKVEAPVVTDDDLAKATVSADRKSITLPKLEKEKGEWIVVLTDGKAYKVDNGESMTLTVPIQPTAQLIKKSVSGQYSTARAIGK